ncbi:pyrroline-5-carboxylate reductase family protein [[Acholeplasma] multilocale]|uniref:pyrroline-5-carboxylate reductase family protein n=1 Tax=[Acholeplasma] multilocale TaxID=264638 RepID=UPI0003FE3FD4|nr:pyrroline-5-carboxylate reductase dimerization domain-containing protein [[Acholeplasma] multilocale]
MNLLFIGVGHMATSLIKGIKKTSSDVNIFINNREKTLAKATELGVHPLEDLKAINNKNIDAIIIGVRPNSLNELSTILDEIDLSNITIVSMLSGVEISTLESAFIKNRNLHLVRIMPNLNAEINMSVTGMCSNGLSEEMDKSIKSVFENCGKVELIDEDLFSEFTIAAGCLPAYVFHILDSYIKATVNSGIDEKTAKRIILNTFEGSVKNASQNTSPLPMMVEQVCVPGGITIEGLKVLEVKKIDEIIEESFQAALARDKK